MALFVFAKIILSVIIVLIFSIQLYKLIFKNKKRLTPCIMLLCLFVLLYIMFYHGAIRTSNVTESDIISFVNIIVQNKSKHFEILNIDPDTNMSSENYTIYEKQFGDFYRWATIVIREYDKVNPKSEIVKGNSYLKKVKPEFLLLQNRKYTAKIQSGEIDGIQYMISPLAANWYGGDAYYGKMWFFYDSTTVYVEYGARPKYGILYLITHPKPSEWNLLEFLD